MNNIIIRAENPESLEVTITITQSLAWWMALKQNLPDRYPGWQLSTAIANAIDKFQKQISEPLEVKP